MRTSRKKLLQRVAVGFASLLVVAGLAGGYVAFWQFESRDVRIPLRDGRSLAATLVKKRFGEPGPVVLELTPYQPNEIKAKFVAAFGYPLVQASCRGTGRSEGDFMPFERDGQDGYDVVEWVARQPWCDGRVAMIGASYAGMTQWLTAKERPPHLRAMAPLVAVGPGIDFPMAGNIGGAYYQRWVDYVRGKMSLGELWDGQSLPPLYRKLYLQHLPFAATDSLDGGREAVFQRWLQHPTYDAYWQHLLPSPQDYARLTLPILSITGYFDADQLGALHYYQQHLRYGSPAALRKHFLVIGPYDHVYAGGNPGAPKDFGGIPLEPAAELSVAKLVGSWLDWVLKGQEKPAFLKDQATYFLLNANAWRSAPTLDQASPDSVRYYLSAEPFTDPQKPALRARLLRPTPPPGAAPPDSLVNDVLALSTASVKAYERLNYFANSLVYDSLVTLPQRVAFYTPVLTEPLELVGVPQLAAYVSLSTPDTDLEMTLHEIDAQGKSRLLTSDCLRVRYRNSLEQAELAVPGRIYRLTFQHARFIGQRLRPGSRLRLVINPLVEPGTQLNYNAGGDLRYESGQNARPCLIRLYHDAAHPSRLLLPVARTGKLARQGP